MDHLIYGLLGYTLIREAFFAYQLNKLTNKLMSRNYYEYEVSKKAGKVIEPEQKVYEDDEPAEDFSQLAGIG